MIEKNISIEAGIANSDEAKKFVASQLHKHCFRILIEPQENNLDEAILNIASIEEIIKPIVNEHSILLHGFDKTVWDLLLLAFQKGYDTRIGLEDTVSIELGKNAKANAELINKAITLKGKNDC